MLQPEKWWQRSNGMSLVYRSEQFLLTGVMQTTWHKTNTVLPLVLSPLLSNLQFPSWFIFEQDSWEWPSWSTKPRFSAEWARTHRISECCAIHCLSTRVHNSSSQLLSSCRAVSAFATNQLCYGSNTGSPWSVAGSRQHDNGSSGYSKIVHFLAGWWALWQKCWSEAKGHLVAQKQGVAGRGEPAYVHSGGHKGSRSQQSRGHTPRRKKWERGQMHSSEWKKKTGVECGIWRGEIKQNLHSLRIIE